MLQGTIVSFLFDLETGKLSKLHRLTVVENCPITCISWRAWISREARDPTLLVNCAANVLCLFRYILYYTEGYMVQLANSLMVLPRTEHLLVLTSIHI